MHVQFRDNPVTVAMPQHVEIQRQINMLKGIIISLLHHYLPERSRTLRQLLDTIYVWLGHGGRFSSVPDPNPRGVARGQRDGGGGGVGTRPRYLGMGGGCQFFSGFGGMFEFPVLF